MCVEVCVHIHTRAHTYMYVQKKAMEAALMHKGQYCCVEVGDLGGLMKMMFYKYKNIFNIFVEEKKSQNF